MTWLCGCILLLALVASCRRPLLRACQRLAYDVRRLWAYDTRRQRLARLRQYERQWHDAALRGDDQRVVLVGSSTLARLPARTLADRPVVNLALNGLTIADVVPAFLPRVAELECAAAVVYVGVNDLVYAEGVIDVPAIVARTVQLLNTFACRVLYLPIIVSPYQRRNGRAADIAAIDAQVRQAAAAHVVVVAPLALDDDFFDIDGLHLNLDGNRQLARHLTAAIADDLATDLFFW